MIPVPFSRAGFSVLDGAGRPVGVLVHDSRSLHGAACRLCGAAIYDQPSWTLTTRWLARHLSEVHAVRSFVVAAHMSRDPGVARLVAQATAALATREQGAA